MTPQALSGPSGTTDALKHYALSSLHTSSVRGIDDAQEIISHSTICSIRSSCAHVFFTGAFRESAARGRALAKTAVHRQARDAGPLTSCPAVCVCVCVRRWQESGTGTHGSVRIGLKGRQKSKVRAWSDGYAISLPGVSEGGAQHRQLSTCLVLLRIVGSWLPGQD